MGFYRTISKMYPKKFRDKLENILLATDVRLPANEIIGFFTSFVIGIALMFSLFAATILKWNLVMTFLISTVVAYGGVYLFALVSADKKTKLIEELLPDALQLMASNLRAGIGIEKSLLLAARPEFGPLKDEIYRVGKEVATGKDVGTALLDISRRVRSKALERVVKLIISGLRSGGKLASLLENSAEDLRVQKLVKEKIKSNVQVYIIFIFVAAGIGAPLLFALSLFLVKVIIANFTNIDIPTTATATIPIVIRAVDISPIFIQRYILVSLTSTSIMSAFTLGLISKGKAKEGSKYIIALIGFAMGLFFLVSYVLRNIFGEIFVL